MVHKTKEDIIYSLYTLSDSTGIRYVGITQQSLKDRLSQHIISCKQAFKHQKSKHKRHCWIKSLLDKEEKPNITKIADFNTEQGAIEAEIQTIAEYQKIYNLVNGTIGGEGTNGHKWTDHQKEIRRFKVDQYDLKGNFIQTYNSFMEASLLISGNERNNGKISGCTKGLRGRRTFYGYVWRLHGEPFDKYPTSHTVNMTPEMRKNYSNSKLGDKNPMKGVGGLKHHSSRPVIITNSENIILTIVESVKESIYFKGLSKSCVEKMLKENKEVANYKLVHASKDIVQSLQKCKSSTLKAFVGQHISILEVG